MTKAYDRYLRSLFYAGALAVIQRVQTLGTYHAPWLAKLQERRPVKVAVIALANKLARMVWTIMASRKDASS